MNRRPILTPPAHACTLLAVPTRHDHCSVCEKQWAREQAFIRAVDLCYLTNIADNVELVRKGNSAAHDISVMAWKALEASVADVDKLLLQCLDGDGWRQSCDEFCKANNAELAKNARISEYVDRLFVRPNMTEAELRTQSLVLMGEVMADMEGSPKEGVGAIAQELDAAYQRAVMIVRQT